MTGDDIADIATFLDTEHPDAVLLIARGAISMGADRAHLIKVASDHCQLRVRVDEEITDHRLDYRTGQATLDGIRTELFELMRRSRSQVSATFPITALERIVAHAERVDACSATVMSRQTVSPSLVEITFAGVGHIESIGGDEYVKVSTQSASAFLTVRRRRVVLGEVDMWFVLHSGGPMSRWARSASVGEQVIMTGPQR